MKAISLHQPWASLLVTRQPCKGCGGQGWFVRPHQHTGEPEQIQCDCSAFPPPMIKRFETRSWPCPPALIGQPLAIHATQKQPTHLARVGDWTTHTSYYTDGLPQMRRLGSVVNGDLVPDGRERGLVIDLPLGAIVGSGRITASLPIVDIDEDIDGTCVVRNGDDLWVDHANEFRITRISDQLPYGDFTPGRYAWLIEDAAPTTERCPWCRGRSSPEGPGPWCEVCLGVGRCDPIPARGRQRIWNWQP